MVFDYTLPRGEEGDVIGMGPPVTPRQVGFGVRTYIGKKARIPTVKAAEKIRQLKAAERRTWWLDHKEKIWSTLSREVKRICSGLLISGPTIDDAMLLTRQVINGGLTRGRTLEVSAASIVSIACNRTGQIRSHEAIAKAAGVSSGNLQKGILFLTKKLGMPYVIPSYRKILSSYVLSILELYNLDHGLYADVYRTALDICNTMEKRGGLSGKGQTSIAVAAIITVLEAKLGKKIAFKKELETLADATKITIFKRIREFKPIVKQ